MSDRPKREKPEEDERPTVFKTDDELMDEIFSPEIREKLKEIAHEKRPKEA